MRYTNDCYNYFRTREIGRAIVFEKQNKNVSALMKNDWPYTFETLSYAEH